MTIERCVATTFPAATGVTNPTYAYDVPSSGTGISSGYTQSGDTLAASLTSNFVSRTFYLSGFAAKTQTWTAANLYYRYAVTTQGDGDSTQWDSYAQVDYCTDWNGTTGTFTGSISNNASDNAGPVEYSSANLGAISLSSSQNPTTVAIRFILTGHAKTGQLPDYILSSSATCQLYHAYIDGTYTAFSVTNLNSNSYCNIGSTYNITGVGLTGSTAVTINGTGASFSVTNSTTISVTIPPMASYGAVTVYVTNGTTQSCTGYINTPGITINTPAAGGVCLVNSTVTCTATITNLANTTVNWTSGGIGSFSPTSTSSGGSTTWTAPATASFPTTATLTATAAGNSSTAAASTRYVYYSPTVSTFTVNVGNNAYVINGTGVLLNWTTANATSTTTNFGSSATSGTSVAVTPASNTVTNYNLTANNPAGSSSASNLFVNAIASPTAGISTNNANPLYGATTVTLTTSNTNNSGLQIGTTGNGSQDIYSGGGGIPFNLTSYGVQSGGFTTSKTYTVSSNSPASGAVAYASVAITVQTVTMSAPTPSGQYTTVGYTRVFTAGTVGGATNTTVNWTATGGSFSPTSTASGGTTTWTAPGSVGTYTIYNTAAANGSTQNSCTVTTADLPVAVINANKTLAVAGDTGVTITPACTGNIWAIYVGTSQGAANIASGTGSINNVPIGVQTGGFAATTTYWVRAYNITNQQYSDASITITLQGAPTFTNNGPVLFGTNVTLTPTFSGTVPTVSPGSWSTWSSGSGQSVTLNTNKLYTLTQSGVGTATTVPQAKLGISTTGLNDVRTITANGGAVSMNDTYVRLLTGTSNNAQVSFSQLLGKYLSTAYYF